MSFNDFSDKNIGLKGKYVVINNLESHGELGVIVSHLNRYFNNPETRKLSITIAPETPLYGNLVVPLSIILRSLRDRGKDIIIHTESEFIKQLCLLNPPKASSENFETSTRILDKIWKIENEFHLNNTVKFLRRFFSQKLNFNEQLLNVLELAIIESIENSLIHSETGSCCFMGQIHRKQNYFTLCVSDSGVGIRKSMELGGLDYDSEAESLASAIKKGVTSKHTENLGGNGLYCLSRLAKINKGHFCLWSGTSSIIVDGKNSNDKVLEYLPKIKFLDQCAHLDFQIPLNEKVTSDYDETPAEDSEINKYSSNTIGFSELKISELEAGYCTRYAGLKAREIVQRFLDFPTVVGVKLDFDGIPICSMSFLDSFLGILCKNIGIKNFNERVCISNSTQEIRKAVYRVTQNR